MLALPFCLVLFLYGEALFKLLFGEKWGEAGHMASLMAPWVFMLIVNVPTTQTLIAKRALNYLLGFNAVYMITRVSGMLVAIYLTGDVYTSILVFSLIGFAANVIYISKGLAVARNG
jgi:O-antigen/teichoic acid export membrane protein